jgi:hypothetical protein
MNHTIVAMVGQKIVRVQCNTCGSTHNHHPAVKPAAVPRAAAQRSSASAPAPAKRSQTDAERQEWTALAQAADSDKARPYAMDGRYRVNETVRHEQFGLGFVRRVAEGKAEILFETGKKLLKCG